MSTELAIKEPDLTPATFTDRKTADALIQRIRSIAENHKPDVTTKAGREAVRSLAYKVARTKGVVKEGAKKLTEEASDRIKKVNAERDHMIEALQEIQDKTRKPLTDWEEAEELRVDRLKERLAAIEHPDLTDASELKDVQEAIADLGLLPTNEKSWQEYASQAEGKIKVELERLTCVARRIEERIERAAREAKEKAEEAARLAEAQRALDAEKAELARQKAEFEAQQKKERDRKAAEEAKRREEQEALEAEQRAKEKAEQEEADRKALAEKAAQDERDRIARAQREADEAEAQRKADEAHRAQVRQDIIADTDMMTVEEVADALIAGKVRHCTVTF